MALIWKLSTLAELPILNSFSSGQGYSLFLFMSVWWRGGTEWPLTASPYLNSDATGSSLGFVLGEMTGYCGIRVMREGGMLPPAI